MDQETRREYEIPISDIPWIYDWALTHGVAPDNSLIQAARKAYIPTNLESSRFPLATKDEPAIRKLLMLGGRGMLVGNTERTVQSALHYILWQRKTPCLIVAKQSNYLTIQKYLAGIGVNLVDNRMKNSRWDEWAYKSGEPRKNFSFYMISRNSWLRYATQLIEDEKIQSIILDEPGDISSAEAYTLGAFWHTTLIASKLDAMQLESAILLSMVLHADQSHRPRIEAGKKTTRYNSQYPVLTNTDSIADLLGKDHIHFFK